MTTMTPEKEMEERAARINARAERSSNLSEQLGLSPEVEGEWEEKAPVEKPVFGYYKTASGEIMVSLTSEMEELYHRREGWEPLPEYGYFDNTTEYSANHPFECLFMKGGSLEFKVSQIVENGWHIEAPTVPGCLQALGPKHKKHARECFRRRRKVQFPQMEGVDVRPRECEYCGRMCQTQQALNQHMGVMHKEETGELRTGNALAEALLRGLQGIPALLQAPGAPVAAPEAADGVNALKTVAVLASAGLTKKQLEALRAAGLVPGETQEGETDGSEEAAFDPNA